MPVLSRRYLGQDWKAPSAFLDKKKVGKKRTAAVQLRWKLLAVGKVTRGDSDLGRLVHHAGQSGARQHEPAPPAGTEHVTRRNSDEPIIFSKIRLESHITT